MSRRGYPSSEIYEERERDYYEPSSHGRRTGRTVYEEDIEIHKGRRAPEPRGEPEFLREDYGRREAGPLVVREEVRERSRERPKRRGREVEETDVVIKRGGRDSPRVKEKEVDETDIIVRRGERERPREREYVERDDFEREVVYRPRDAGPPPVRSEREEFVFRRQEREREREREYEPRERFEREPPPGPLPIRSEREEFVFRAPRVREPSPEPERTEISIRERSRGPAPRDRGFEEEISIRESRGPAPRERERGYDEEISIRERSRGPAPRGRERDYEEEDIVIRRDERRPPPRERERDFEEEDFIIRRREPFPPREKPREVEEEEITIKRDERRRPRAASYERDSLTISTSERERPRAKSTRGDFQGEEQQIIIRRNDGRSRARSRGDYEEEEIDIRRGGGRERERPRERSRETHRGDYEDITFKHDDSNGRHKDEIIIRRPERSPSPEPIREPVREPEPTRAPPIVQEIITHHRHIDHGKMPSREAANALLTINRLRTCARATTSSHSTKSPYSPKSSLTISTDKYLSGTRNGRHYDEDIVFERETGGRRHFDGVRRSERHEEEESRELTIIDNRDRGRRFEAEKSKKDRMWTEITKDLVSEEAIKEVGYEYEDTEEFYYVMEYLRYEDVHRLVELTEDIKRDRRERIREIQAEREFAERRRQPLALPAPGWDEERVVEREVIYDRGPPPRRYR
ncbi:hypothetical protein P7C71_g4981, partial [Lecanoromycetidae sp. Uapishka_2]